MQKLKTMTEINIKLIEDDGKGIERNSFVNLKEYIAEPFLKFESDEIFFCENGGWECLTQCEFCKKESEL
tara:strand:- start:3908 stop:4117 length:210 start_codon:yes stop_codon:yes gene_type:complete